MDTVNKILLDIKNGNIKPIYFLMGEEPYYIDLISDYIENNVLSEEEKGFNQMVLYGRDVSVEDIIDNAKRYPMMSDRQIIIVKEAQDLSRTIENLESYALNPQPTTILVINFKYKTLDKRKKLFKVVDKIGVVFDSKKLYDDKVADWIRNFLLTENYKIDTKAALMLVEFLGNDLSKIAKELEKLLVILPKNITITPTDIEENIGISKDYNTFELRKAFGEKNILKTTEICNYFSENQKANPIVFTIGMLHSFFTQLLIYHSLKDKSRGNVAKALKINPYFVSDYITAAKNYPMRKVSQIIGLLREADLKSKGVGVNTLGVKEIYQELSFKILH